VSLGVEFLGERWELEAGQDFNFGRAGDLCVDESNLYMHRVVGLVRHVGDTWWLHNVGEWLELEVRSDTGSRHTLTPSTRLALIARCDVRFTAGKARYEITLVPSDPPANPGEVRVVADVPSTNRFGVVELNDEQRLLVVALCEDQLGGTGDHQSVPSNRAVAHRLGWSITKFNRKLDYLCRRLASEGVPGLRGGVGHRASDRRGRLIEHALVTGMVSDDDLALLDELD
jgi:hypothetical protein